MQKHIKHYKNKSIYNNYKSRNFNLKVGDIVYFKSYLTNEFKGVVSGDGIASNKLECV